MGISEWAFPFSCKDAARTKTRFLEIKKLIEDHNSLPHTSPFRGEDLKINCIYVPLTGEDENPLPLLFLCMHPVGSLIKFYLRLISPSTGILVKIMFGNQAVILTHFRCCEASSIFITLFGVIINVSCDDN